MDETTRVKAAPHRGRHPIEIPASHPIPASRADSYTDRTQTVRTVRTQGNHLTQYQKCWDSHPRGPCQTTKPMGPTQPTRRPGNAGNNGRNHPMTHHEPDASDLLNDHMPIVEANLLALEPALGLMREDDALGEDGDDLARECRHPDLRPPRGPQ